MVLNQLGSIDLGPLDDGLQDLGLPVPVQTFLWGQIAPFIRPKLGKLHEATCMVRILSLIIIIIDRLKINRKVNKIRVVVIFVKLFSNNTCYTSHQKNTFYTILKRKTLISETKVLLTMIVERIERGARTKTKLKI